MSTFARHGLATSLALVLLLVLPAQGSAGDLLDRVAARIRQYPHYSIFDAVDATAAGGVVTLRGKVTRPDKREAIAREVAQVDGVVRVENRLDVLTSSASDEALRHRLARAVYGSGTFGPYAAAANPPIHILVERGEVTLAGVVSTHADRMHAQALATSVGAAPVRNMLKTEADVLAGATRLP